MKTNYLKGILAGTLAMVALSTVSRAANYDLTVDYVIIDTGESKTKGLSLIHI